MNLIEIFSIRVKTFETLSVFIRTRVLIMMLEKHPEDTSSQQSSLRAPFKTNHQITIWNMSHTSTQTFTCYQPQPAPTWLVNIWITNTHLGVSDTKILLPADCGPQEHHHATSRALWWTTIWETDAEINCHFHSFHCWQKKTVNRGSKKEVRKEVVNVVYFFQI